MDLVEAEERVKAVFAQRPARAEWASVLGWAPLLLIACETVTVGPPPPSSSPERSVIAQPIVEDPGDAPCETLDRASCLRSLVCTLAAPSARDSERYACRPASGNCEVGLRQIADDEDRCTARTGCRWSAAPCYCACRGAGRTAVADDPATSPCECECRGGPPPGCMPRG